mmetsp:Transcript_37264/g.112674  ORF Transcript_37264/g.112674 Transcript_37264/m.112674 type:complete len:397 (-) Transcript_37264:963-2153(-)
MPRRARLLPGAHLLQGLHHGSEAALVQAQHRDDLGTRRDCAIRRDAVGQLRLAYPLAGADLPCDLAVYLHLAVAPPNDKEEILVLALDAHVLALVDGELLQAVRHQRHVGGAYQGSDAGDLLEQRRILFDALLVRHGRHQLEVVAAQDPQEAIFGGGYGRRAGRVVQDGQLAEGVPGPDVQGLRSAPSVVSLRDEDVQQALLDDVQGPALVALVEQGLPRRQLDEIHGLGHQRALVVVELQDLAQELVAPDGLRDDDAVRLADAVVADDWPLRLQTDVADVRRHVGGVIGELARPVVGGLLHLPAQPQRLVVRAGDGNRRQRSACRGDLHAARGRREGQRLKAEGLAGFLGAYVVRDGDPSVALHDDVEGFGDAAVDQQVFVGLESAALRLLGELD